MINFRLARPYDLECILSITHNAITDMQAKGIDQWDEFYPDSAILMEDIGRQEMILIENADQTAGFLTLNTCQDPEYATVNWNFTGKIMVIHRLTIKPMQQGKGLGFKLMNHAESYAKQSGTEIIRLDAFSQNGSANALYRKLGYQYAGPITFRKGVFNCYEKILSSDTFG